MINSKQPLTTDMASTSTETAEIGWLNQFQYLFYFFYLKSTTEGPEGHLYCRKNTETHKKTKKTNKQTK